MGTPRSTVAQAPDETTVEAVEVGDGVTRYAWSIAFTRICMSLPCKDRDIAIAAAMRLVEYPARGSGQCNAKRVTIANELGISERHLNRGLKVLKDHGFIRVERHGRDDAVITLLIPPADADIHRFGSRKSDVQQDDNAVPLNGSPTGQKRPPNGTGNGVQSDTQCGKTKSQVYQKEQSTAQPPCAPVPAERPVSEPMTIDAESGAYRALCLAHPEGLDPNTAIEERAIFDQLVKDGYDPEQLIEDAYDYGDTHRGIEVPSFRHWLLSKP
jgi:hypothetical protein